MTTGKIVSMSGQASGSMGPPPVLTKAKWVLEHVEITSNPQPAFFLYEEQSKAASDWKKSHDAEKHIPKGKTQRYSGAIGGAYTYEFTPTSIGLVVKVSCCCGETIDISDYNEW